MTMPPTISERPANQPRPGSEPFSLTVPVASARPPPHNDGEVDHERRREPAEGADHSGLSGAARHQQNDETSEDKSAYETGQQQEQTGDEPSDHYRFLGLLVQRKATNQCSVASREALPCSHEMTFRPGSTPADRRRSYSATLTHKDGAGATIGNSVTLTATTRCLKTHPRACAFVPLGARTI
jgi:hypothetical protein